MPIVLSHNTALEVLRAIPPQSGLLTPFASVLPGEELHVPRSGELTQTLARYGILPGAMHVLAESGARRSRARGICAHATAADPLSAGSLLELEPDLLVCGPELCFVQMSRRLTPVGVAVLGHELCGEYAHFSRLVSGYYERPALVTVDSIHDEIDALGNFYGKTRAQRALQWVRGGSRSPMETVVSCELFLPAAEGGFGFAAPQLNYQVSLDDAASKMTGTSCCYVDVAYPDQLLGFEYDSAEYHTDPSRDRRRREALQHMGWRIVTVDLDCMADYGELLKTVSLVRDVIPRQVDGESFSAKRGRELHGRLLRATRCGLGLGAALFGVPVPSGTKVHVRA